MIARLMILSSEFFSYFRGFWGEKGKFIIQSHEGMWANLERIRHRLAGRSYQTVAILKIL